MRLIFLLGGSSDRIGVSRVDAAPRSLSRSESVGNIALAAHKARRDEQQLAGQRLLGSGDLSHYRASGGLVLFRLELHGDNSAELSGVVLEELLDRRLINARIVTVERDRLLLTVVGLADPRPLRPRIVRQTLIGGFRHHLELDHRLAALPDARSDAVVAGISAADDHYVLPLGRRTAVRKLLAVKPSRRVSEEIDREIYALCVSALGFEIARLLCSAAEHYRVKL